MLAAAPALAQTSDTASADNGEIAGYCDRAFYPADENGDGMISQDEAAALGKAAYKSIDANADGSIDRDELTNCMETSAAIRQAMSGSTDDAFARLDTDQSGDISAKEYQTSVSEHWKDAQAWSGDSAKGWSGEDVSNTGQDATAEGSKMTGEEFMAQSGNTFRMTDADRSGTLSKEEYGSRSQAYEYDEDLAGKTFDGMDQNGDDMVSQEEFLEAMDKAHEQARTAAEHDGYYDSAKGAPATYIYMYAM